MLLNVFLSYFCEFQPAFKIFNINVYFFAFILEVL